MAILGNYFHCLVIFPILYVKGINKDTLIITGWDPINEGSWLFRVTNSGAKIDTLLFFDIFRNLKGRLFLFGNKEMIIDWGNPTASSDDGGISFDSLADKKAPNFEYGARFFAAWSKKNMMFLVSRLHADIIMYDTNFNINSVNHEKIHNFQTKLYPNPVFAQKPLNIEIENDRLRNIRISTYNIEGVKLDMSDEVSIPRGFYSFTYQPKMLNTGTYFIVIESGGEIIAREKFIVK